MCIRMCVCVYVSLFEAATTGLELWQLPECSLDRNDWGFRLGELRSCRGLELERVVHRPIGCSIALHTTSSYWFRWPATSWTEVRPTCSATFMSELSKCLKSGGPEIELLPGQDKPGKILGWAAELLRCTRSFGSLGLWLPGCDRAAKPGATASPPGQLLTFMLPICPFRMCIFSEELRQQEHFSNKMWETRDRVWETYFLASSE